MEAKQKRKRSFETYRVKVDKIEELTPRNCGLRFRLPPGKSIQFKAGQFVQVFVPQEKKTRRTSYSIASSPQNQNFVELCVTLVDGGKSSNFIHHLKMGDEVSIMGPLGRFTQPDPLTKDVVFICTGSGIAPFRSMIYNLTAKKTSANMYLVFGNRYDDDIIYKGEWDKLAQENNNFKVLFTLSRPEKWTGEKGYVQEKIEQFVPEVTSKDYYICGLSNMINAVQEKLLSLGVPKEHIHFEKYD